MTRESYAETTTVSIPAIDIFAEVISFVKEYEFRIIFVLLSITSAAAFLYFYYVGLGIAYNDARSHLDIGRRVVENLKPGLAQLGSVWLPLPHFLMLFTIWNDFMWHSGLSGAIVSMISYVGSGLFIWKILKKLDVAMLGRLIGVFAFAANANVLYLQSTAMTELLFLLTFCGTLYELISWYKSDEVWDLAKGAFWIMLSTLTRYDAWFIFIIIVGLVAGTTYIKRGFKAAEGAIILFATLGSFGMLLWLLWNYLIFGDPLFSFFGPYSAYAQQKQIYDAGELITKWNIFNSVKIYALTMYYTIGLFNLLMGLGGMLLMFVDRNINKTLKIILPVLLLSPLAFNIIALFLGHSIISIVHVFGDNWFNVRYGIVVLPSVAIYIGYFIQKANNPTRYILIPALLFAYISSYFMQIPVTIQDALWGASSKNISQVSNWLKANASNDQDKIFISAGSHDAIIFSSGFDMKRFIHEGTGNYWKDAGENPDHWVRYIVMRTYDMKDATYYTVQKGGGLTKYDLVLRGEFADIYELKPEYRSNLVSPDSFPKDLNSKISEGVLKQGQTISSATSTTTGVFGITSMFGIVSTALFMANLESNPRKKRSIKVHTAKGKANAEYGFNLVTLRQVNNAGFEDN